MARASVIEVEPIRREGASNIVVDRLLGLVKAGRLAPGDRLPSERQLAEMFGVSRPTVREALRGLSVLGVVEIRHGGGLVGLGHQAAAPLAPRPSFLSAR